MKIETMFSKRIARDINGVIQVEQNDEKIKLQELEEYIVTKEIKKHLSTFYSNYEKSLEGPTDKMGVWISGFFGSGKSHFLKILDYLLSDVVVKNKSAVEFFREKIDDPMMMATIEQCSKVDTETILFNIDANAPINKDKTAILRVFAKMFYEHCGYFGSDLKVVKLERFLVRLGKYDEFKSNFQEVNGSKWDDSRDSYSFFEDDIVEVLMKTVEMSEVAARNWFNGVDSIELNITQLANDIKEYIDTRGSNSRLVFLLDEVGQYIGADSDLMLNLQTIVESLGTICKGRVWVIVTSQEEIDSVTKIVGDDFSKIQGRFSTRLSLTSSSVDEVIKKRILAKSDLAKSELKLVFDKKQAILKNLFSFTGAMMDLKGYEGETDFVDSYPFVNYQYILLQNVFVQVRKHGFAGKSIAKGERSMISGFHESVQKMKDKDTGALVPFYIFYDTIQTFLDSSVRGVIERCYQAASKNEAVQLVDVDVLKLLFMIRYIDDIKSNVDTLSILMVDDIQADKIAIRESVQKSLDRLVSQNYVSRNGEIYAFLTDDEQDISREIKQIIVDNAKVTNGIAEAIFGRIYPSRKVKYRKYDFSFDQLIDNTLIGSSISPIKLRIVTVASDLSRSGDETLNMKSRTNNEAIIVLSDESHYYDELESSLKIRQYVKQKNVAAQSETIQGIIRGKQQQASSHEARANSFIEEAIIKGQYFIFGKQAQVKGSTAKERIDFALSYLVECVYTKLDYVTTNYESDADIIKILNGSAQSQLPELDNHEAVQEIENYLEAQNMQHKTVSMADIQTRFQNEPFGYREIDIAALTATLIQKQKIIVLYSGGVIAPIDKKLVEYLRKKSEIDKLEIRKKVSASDVELRCSKDIVSKFLDKQDVPSSEESFVAYTINAFTNKRDYLVENLKQYQYGNYPGKKTVEDGKKYLESILDQKSDNIAFIKKINEQENKLLDWADDYQSVENFFKSQRQVFDSATKLIKSLILETDYLVSEETAVTSLSEIKDIIESEMPFSRISKIPTLIQAVESAYTRLVEKKRLEVQRLMESLVKEIEEYATEQESIVTIVDGFKDYIKHKKDEYVAAKQLGQLDAMVTRLYDMKKRVVEDIIQIPKDGVKSKTRYLRKEEFFKSKTLKNQEDVELYLIDLRNGLEKELLDVEEIKIS